MTAGNVVGLWEVATARVIRETRGTGRAGHPLAFSPPGNCVVCVSGNTVRVWNAETEDVATALQGHEDLVLGLAWSKVGRFIAMAGNDRKGLLWDAVSGLQIRTFDY